MKGRKGRQRRTTSIAHKPKLTPKRPSKAKARTSPRPAGSAAWWLLQDNVDIPPFVGITPTGLSSRRKTLTVEQWESIGRALCRRENCIEWSLGDWLRADIDGGT